MPLLSLPNLKLSPNNWQDILTFQQNRVHFQSDDSTPRHFQITAPLIYLEEQPWSEVSLAFILLLWFIDKSTFVSSNVCVFKLVLELTEGSGHEHAMIIVPGHPIAPTFQLGRFHVIYLLSHLCLMTALKLLRVIHEIDRYVLRAYNDVKCWYGLHASRNIQKAYPDTTDH